MTRGRSEAPGRLGRGRVPRLAVLRIAVLAAAVLLWAGSLVLPAVAVGGGPTVSGLDVLLRGWQGLPRGVVAWLANPAFGVALALSALGRDRAAAIASTLTALLGLSSLVMEDILRWRIGSVPPLAFHAGFYVWCAAQLWLCLCSWTLVWVGELRCRAATRQAPPPSGSSRD